MNERKEQTVYARVIPNERKEQTICVRVIQKEETPVCGKIIQNENACFRNEKQFVGIELPSDLIDLIDKRAHKDGHNSRSAVIQKALNVFFAMENEKEK